MTAINSAAGAVQLSSQSEVPTSPAIASQMPRYGAEPERVPAISKAQAGGHCVTRRTVMNIAVGSVVAAATIIPASAAASTTKTPLNVDSARPELRKKWKALQHAYETFKDAHATHKVAWDMWGQWENANPCPSNHRAYRKWERRSDKYQAEINLDTLRDQLDHAEREYQKAQVNLGLVRAVDFDEITLKACASMAFEGGVLDGKDSRPLHLNRQQQIVAWSIAMDAVLLSSHSNGETDAPAMNV